MKLACGSFPPDGYEDFSVSYLELTLKGALKLREYLAIADGIAKRVDGFYRFTVFDYSVRWGHGITPWGWQQCQDTADEVAAKLGDAYVQQLDELEEELSNGEWLFLPKAYEWDEEQEGRQDASTMCIGKDDIIWKTYAKHGDATQFETRELTRARLNEAIARLTP